jgi:hypothetical protein
LENNILSRLLIKNICKPDCALLAGFYDAKSILPKKNSQSLAAFGLQGKKSA